MAEENSKPYSYNKDLYKTDEAVIRKWLSIYRKVSNHGDKMIYEKLLTEAFNFTEFIMDNFIEYYRYKKFPRNQLEIIDKSIVKFPGIEKPIDFKQYNSFYMKTEFLQLVGLILPKDITEVRKKRNKYVHSTESFKAVEGKEIEDYETFKRYIVTLGKTICAIKKYPKAVMYPEYEGLKLQVGEVIGKYNQYSARELLCEDAHTRKFVGETKDKKENIYITEIIPYGDIDEIYEANKKMLSVRKSSIVRTVDVVTENKTCYLIKEKIDGLPLQKYLEEKNFNTEVCENIYEQIMKIARILTTMPYIHSDMRVEDFIVDDTDTVWLTEYHIWGETASEEQVKQCCEKLLFPNGINAMEMQQEAEGIKESLEPQVEERYEAPVPEVIKPRNVEVPSEQVEPRKVAEESDVVELRKMTDAGNTAETAEENNVIKLGAVIGVCACILAVLWIISNYLG